MIIGYWGLGIGDWGLGPIPNPHPQSPINKIENNKLNFYLFIFLYLNNKYYLLFNFYYNLFLYINL